MTLVQYPLILPGQLLTASVLSSPETTAYKSADTSRASNTTVTADPELSVPVLANFIYSVEAYLDYEGAASGSAGGMQLTVSSNGTLRFDLIHTFNFSSSPPNAAVGNTTQGGGTVTLDTNGAGVLCGAVLRGTLIAGASNGSVTVNWAQNTSSVTATIMHQTSRLTVRRIG